MHEHERETPEQQPDAPLLEGTTAAPQPDPEQDESPAERDMRQAYEQTPTAKTIGTRPRKQRG